MRQWMVAAKKADFYVIAEKFHVDPVVARIIRNREVIGEKNIRIYLGGNLSDLSDPHQMKDMDRLVEILAQKIRKQVHIRIIGDYDVDGVTSSHLFLTALRRVGAKVDVVIPHRIQDGYGLSLHLLQQAKEDGVDTILTCDNGIAAIDEIAWAKAQKMTVLVTDHHAVPFEEHEGRRTEKKSLADAVVNPHQQDCGYPYKELCGAGVAWNVIRVLYENYDMDKREAEDLLDFVAMATVCDVMSLTGENRILVKEGLKRIRHTKNIGLQALMQACNVQPENISAYHFGYVLGPCVNATGRLDTARHALRLFETGHRCLHCAHRYEERRSGHCRPEYLRGARQRDSARGSALRLLLLPHGCADGEGFQGRHAHRHSCDDGARRHSWRDGASEGRLGEPHASRHLRRLHADGPSGRAFPWPSQHHLHADDGRPLRQHGRADRSGPQVRLHEARW